MNINEQILKEVQDHKCETRDLAKYFLSEFQRSSKNNDKTVDNETAIKILKSFKKDIEEQVDVFESNEYERMLNFIDRFIPKEANEDDIREFLNTIDFSQLNSKNQAIGMVKKHFSGNVDGKLIAKIVQNEY